VNVLIISASMGAGHDGAAHELERRLEADGHRADVVDYLTAFPLGLGRLVRFSYEWELRYAAWTYEMTYRLWILLPMLAAPLMWLLATLTDRRIRGWVDRVGADVVVSTYPLASLALGRLRRQGSLDIPASTYITDFAVHPLWAAQGIDLHLAVHPRAAQSAHRQTGAPALAPGPLVSSRFTAQLPERQAARADLGIPADRPVALLVAGSWGVGAIKRTYDAIVATGEWLPLVVCGHNEHLRRKLEARGDGIVFGWTDQMPLLMAAADVLVENAGGLTCMEAFASGLPVVTYRPIAGHGRGNAKEMAAAGVAALADTHGLQAALDASLGPEGETRRQAGRAMFAADPANCIMALARQHVRAPASSRALAGAGRAPRRVVAWGAAATTAVVLGVGLSSVGASVAAAAGVAVARPPKHASAAYIGIRLGSGATGSSTLPRVLARADMTAIVSGQMALADPTFVSNLADAGCDVVNGGWGHHRGLRWEPSDIGRSKDAIEDATGSPVHLLAAGPSVSGFELAAAEWDDERVVVAHTLGPAESTQVALHAGQAYIIDARDLTPAEVTDLIGALQASRVHIEPLSSL
jgi:processive 1,2-diacylglycerol beta-glucosyltransferase